MKIEINIKEDRSIPLQEFIDTNKIGSICKITSNTTCNHNVNDILMIVGETRFDKRLINLKSEYGPNFGEMWGTSYENYRCLPLTYELSIK